MNQVARQDQLAVLDAQLNRQNQVEQFVKALPKHIPVDRFIRIVRTGVQQNPKLLDADRGSLLSSCMKAAQDGLLPDGRLGALVIYQEAGGIKKVQWLPMIAGLRQKVRNSGEIVDWNAHVVHANDQWDYEEGDNPHIMHRPVRGERGPVIAAYSVARYRTGEISREWMWFEELEKVRAVSRAKHGPWQDWTDEMYRKTVAKRHAKILPMSSDLDDLLRRPDEPGGEGQDGGVKPLVAVTGQATPSAALSAAFDQLSGPRSPCDHVWSAPFDGAVKCTKCGATQEALDDGFDGATGEVIDAGEYAESDHEELPKDEQAKPAAKMTG